MNADPITNSIVRILNSRGDTLGTGFIADESGIVITSTSILPGVQIGSTVNIGFHINGETAVTRFIALDETNSISILHLDMPLPDNVIPMRVGSSKDVEGRVFKTFGYPLEFDEGLAGQCEVIGETTLEGARMLQCRSSEVRGGYAGAPVWDTGSSTVVGMIHALHSSNQMGMQYQTVFVIPVERLQTIVSTAGMQYVRSNAVSRERTLSWLHLGDLRVRTKFDSSKVEAFLEDIQQQIQQSGTRPDFVAVTGDIAYSGRWDEYKLAAKLLNTLPERLGIPHDRLLIVPGNHDINRRAVRTDVQQDTLDVLRHAERGLENYRNLVDRLRLVKSSPQQPVYKHTFEVGEQTVAIWGLDTAVIGDSHQDLTAPQREYFLSQVQYIEQSINQRQVNIALLHHSPERLTGLGLRSAAETLQRTVDFILHAHLHSPNEPRVQQREIGAVVIQSGADPSFDSYNIVTLNFDTGLGTITFRRRTEDRWLSDSRPPGGQIRFELSQRLLSIWSPESEVWSRPLVGYSADTTDGIDQLSIDTEVNAFSAVIASKKLIPPLCLGLFGDWGSGKTFFMKKMEDRIALLAKKASEADQESAFCSHIVQITFNAWHYLDASLWACLIDRIFEGLDDFIVKEKKQRQRQYLLKELKLATDLRAEAECRKEAAEQQVSKIEENLMAVREKRVNEQMRLRDLLSTLSLSQVLEEEDRKQLQDLARKLGLPQTYHDVEDLDSALRATRTLTGRLQAALLAPENRGLGLVWLLIILVIVPLLGIGTNALLNRIGDFPELVNTVAALFSQISVFVVAVKGGLNLLLERIAPTVDELEEALAEARNKVQERREEISQEEAEMAAELSVLKEKETAAVLALEQARARVDQAELALKELETAADTRQLGEFIQERVASQEYKKHLGVISTIRKDLKTLSIKLHKARQTDQDGDLPRIDRIVLYIDDLDRCPEERVVDVLQAVHLLLAFDLFVVVVGVDSRWLLRALEETYSTLQIPSHQRDGWSPEEIWAWQSTPQNYLEKIFQIPYNLPPMEEEGFRQLVSSILLPSEIVSDFLENEPMTVSPTDPSRPGEADVVEPRDEEDLPDDLAKDSTRDTGVATVVPEVNLNPNFLEIKEEEQEFIGQLAPLIPTPRATKRFINIYRLIRATILEDDLPAFVGNPENPGEYRVVMVLLAILTGYPRQSPYIFRKLLSLPPTSDWQAMLTMLTPRYVPDTEPPQYQNQIAPAMGVAEANQWLRLQKALLAIEGLPSEIEPFAKRTLKVARFSFRVGKITDGDTVTVESLVSDTDGAREPLAGRTLKMLVDAAELVDRIEPLMKLPSQFAELATKVDDALDKIAPDVGIRITHVEFDPPGSDAEGEYVEIRNQGFHDQSMKDWELSDEAHHTFEFPDFTLPAGKAVKVWVGQGTSSDTDLYWEREAPVWNNDGDIAELRDASGTLIDAYKIVP